jgi:hypothetical protein
MHSQTLSLTHTCVQARHRAIVVQLRRLPALTSYAVLMTSGGKFAGAVYNKGTCVLHKAFKKYVIRAKQGGLQVTHMPCVCVKERGRERVCVCICGVKGERVCVCVYVV